MIYAKEDKGVVRIYNVLPKDYQINGIKHNLSVLPIETINEQGFYELIVPTITENQRLEELLPSDLIGTQYIQRVYDYTQAELDEQLAIKVKEDKIATFYETHSVVWQGENPIGETWGVVIGNDGKLSTIKIN